MKKPLAIMLLFFSLAYSQPSIAVVEFEGKGISQTEASALTDRFSSELFTLGTFRLIERDQMEDILEEQGFQQTGCVTAECAVEVGMMVGAEQIITGSISRVGNVISVSSKIVNVSSGEIIKISTYDFKGEVGELLTVGMKQAVAQLTSAISDVQLMSVDEIRRRAGSHKARRNRWLLGSVISFTAGGFLNYTSEQTYDEYLTAQDNAGELRERIELFDLLTPSSLGAASLMASMAIIEHLRYKRFESRLAESEASNNQDPLNE